MVKVGSIVRVVEVSPKWGAETFRRDLDATTDYIVRAVSNCGALIQVSGMPGVWWGVSSFEVRV